MQTACASVPLPKEASGESHAMRVLPALESMVTVVTKRTSAAPVGTGTPALAATKSSASPTLIALAVPLIHVHTSDPKSFQGISVDAGSALQPITAVKSAEVSNVCGLWPGPGMLCTRVLAGISTLSGAPGALERVKASTAEAATPGEGT